MLLDDSDLKELGFLMGPRKQLLQWIKTHSTECSPTVTARQTASASASIPSTPVTPQPSTSAAASSRIRKFQVTTVVVSQ